ncbi:MAG: type 3 dihydrofolate reductase [Pasteurellaceae bacterium]|nr:type 3 dihydrofolate reductase [Pasteurellaceae bacterium]
MQLSVIVACTQNWVIGKNNQMPWHLPADLAWFRQHTQGKPVIMGRKTFESIGRPLPKRTNIVLSRQPFTHQGVIWCHSFEQALQQQTCPEIMLIGGGELFKQYLPLANKLYLTQIQTVLDGDTFFPELNWQDWQIIFEQWHRADEKNTYDCRFLILERK